MKCSNAAADRSPDAVACRYVKIMNGEAGLTTRDGRSVKYAGKKSAVSQPRPFSPAPPVSPAATR